VHLPAPYRDLTTLLSKCQPVFKAGYSSNLQLLVPSPFSRLVSTVQCGTAWYQAAGLAQLRVWRGHAESVQESDKCHGGGFAAPSQRCEELMVASHELQDRREDEASNCLLSARVQGTGLEH